MQSVSLTGKTSLQLQEEREQRVIKLLETALERISVRPSFALPMTASLHADDQYRALLHVEWRPQAVEKFDGSTIALVARFSVPRYLEDEVAAILWIRACFVYVLKHELDEFMELDEVPALNPHHRTPKEDVLPGQGELLEDRGACRQVAEHVQRHPLSFKKRQAQGTRVRAETSQRKLFKPVSLTGRSTGNRNLRGLPYEY